MEWRRDRIADPYFSICIPQYNRTSFLLECLRSMAVQTFRDFEVCISDDCSTDAREQEVLDFLEQSDLSYVYRRQARNSRYDANLRASIALARGEFCLLLGNDDQLSSPDSLAEYHTLLASSQPVGVATCNFRDGGTGQVVRRIKAARMLPGGPATAANVYRNFSAVAGVVLKRDLAQAHATDRWDGAEMYQTYLASRIIAQGWSLLYVDRPLVQMGTVLPGETVDHVLRRPRLDPCPIVERRLTLTKLARIVDDAIAPYAPSGARQRYARWIATQLYLFPYPYWLVAYRRAQSWRYAVGIGLGMRPRNVLEGMPLSWRGRAWLSLVYGLVSLAGLLVPPWLFDASRRPLFRLAKALA
jgi:glycosyltransferase involved in cell wall biosynthesis